MAFFTKKGLLFLFIVLAFSPIYAQIDALRADKLIPRNEFGVTAGYNIGAQLPEKVNTTDKGGLGVSPRLGLLYKYNFTRRFGIQAEWAFSRKQATFEAKSVDDTISFSQVIRYGPAPTDTVISFGRTTFSGTTYGSFDIQYLEFQLMTQYRIGSRVCLSFGGYAADIYKGTNKGYAVIDKLGTSTNKFDNQDFDNSPNLNRFDYGVVGGISVNLLRGLNLYARFTGGSRSVYRDDYKQVKFPIRNTYLQVGGEYHFGDGGRI